MNKDFFTKDFFKKEYPKLSDNSLIEQIILDTTLLGLQTSAIFSLKLKVTDLKEVKELAKWEDVWVVKKIYKALDLTEEELSNYYNLAYIEDKFDDFLKEIDDRTAELLENDDEIRELVSEFFKKLDYNYRNKDKE